MFKCLFSVLFILHLFVVQASHKCDTLVIEDDTLVLTRNNWGETIDISKFLGETERILEGNINVDSLDINEIIHITRLYNTAVFCGEDFFHFNIKFIAFYAEYLSDVCYKKLKAIPDGSGHYSIEYNIHIGGHIFYHENSRYKITCDSIGDD